MLSPPHIEIHRHPRFFQLRIDQRLFIFRIDVSEVIPAGPCPLGHGVRFPSIAFSVECDVQPLVVCLRERRLRPAMRLEVLKLWKAYGQITFRHSTFDTSQLAVGTNFVQNRKRLAPESLAREQPVTQFVVDCFSGTTVLVQHRGDRGFNSVGLLAVKITAVDCVSFSDKTNVAFHDLCTLRMVLRWIHHWNHFQIELLCKFKVTLIVGRNRHDCTSPVPSQNIISDPDRNLLTIDWVGGMTTGEDTSLCTITIGAFTITLERGFFAVAPYRIALLFCRQLFKHLMLGRHHHVRCPKQRVGPCRVDPQHRRVRLGRKTMRPTTLGPFVAGCLIANIKINLSSRAASNPITL